MSEGTGNWGLVNRNGDARQSMSDFGQSIRPGAISLRKPVGGRSDWVGLGHRNIIVVGDTIGGRGGRVGLGHRNGIIVGNTICG